VKFLNEIPGTEAKFAKGPKEEKIFVTYEPGKAIQLKQVTKYDEVLDKVKTATTSCSHLNGTVTINSYLKKLSILSPFNIDIYIYTFKTVQL
jgi:hypothetical protein